MDQTTTSSIKATKDDDENSLVDIMEFVDGSGGGSGCDDSNLGLSLPWDFDLRQYINIPEVDPTTKRKPYTKVGGKKRAVSEEEMPTGYICSVPGCGRLCPTHARLSLHIGKSHRADDFTAELPPSNGWRQPGRFQCTWPRCIRGAETKQTIIKHIRGAHFKLGGSGGKPSRVDIPLNASFYLEDRKMLKFKEKEEEEEGGERKN